MINDFFRPLSLEELKAQWPTSEDAQLCARLVTRFLNSKMIETAEGADANPLSAQADAAVNKAHAALVKQFGKIAFLQEAKPDRPKVKPLRRFAGKQQEQNQSETK